MNFTTMKQMHITNYGVNHTWEGIKPAENWTMMCCFLLFAIVAISSWHSFSLCHSKRCLVTRTRTNFKTQQIQQMQYVLLLFCTTAAAVVKQLYTYQIKWCSWTILNKYAWPKQFMINITQISHHRDFIMV